MKLFEKIKQALISKRPDLGISEDMTESEVHQAIEDAPTSEDIQSNSDDITALNESVATLKTEVETLTENQLTEEAINKLIDKKIKDSAVDTSSFLTKEDLSGDKPEGDDTRLSVVKDIEALQSEVADIKAGKISSEATSTKPGGADDAPPLDDFEKRVEALKKANAEKRNQKDK